MRRTRVQPVLLGVISIAALLSGPQPDARAPAVVTIQAPGKSHTESADPHTATDKAIRQFERRVKEDPRDFISFTVLGELHIRKGRQSGDLASYRRAETALSRALELNPGHLAAKGLLASAYASQHKFAEAIDLAGKLYAQSNANIDALAVLADSYLEIGNYKDGEKAVRQLAAKAARSPAVMARLAHVAELKGRDAEAVDLLRKAGVAMRQLAEAEPDIAWYETRLANLYYHRGCLDEAAAHFETALKLFDGYYIGLVGLAEVRAGQGRLKEAETLYARAAATAPQPGTLFDLGALYQKLGRTAEAHNQYTRAEAMARRPDIHQAAYYRDLALFYADQPGKTKEALEVANRDLAIRKDVEGYDTLAWALYRNDRLQDAAAASAEAMKLGTKDPEIYYHAGMIFARLGNRDKARAYLEEALRLGRHMLPDDAASTLTKLGSSPQAAASCSLGTQTGKQP
ncbi:MAG: tetratricopeptide repeat protein [Acidobacteria bacterium]|nr:tetratricopeptide repeat protein [Acidobacteriota bacterium]MCA1652262.1 tetratricopeptide repeat protein [Acidobacteriota bacterium]